MKTTGKVNSRGPRIYNLFPPLLGSVAKWEKRLPAIARMGFDWIFLNPFHLPGASGSLYSVKDYYRLHPALQGSSEEAPSSLLKGFLDAAEDAGVKVMLDLVVNHTAKDSPLVQKHPEWYVHGDDGGVASPYAVDPDDPDKITVWGDLAELDYSERPERDSLLRFWDEVVAHYVGLGFHGFRCDAAYKLPGEVWGELIGSARATDPEVWFFAETLGAQIDEVDQLRPAGFDYFFNSAKWWDFRKDWLLEQYEQFRHVAPSVAFPESHDTERVAAVTDDGERDSRFWYLFTALFSSGVMMPIGYELGFRKRLHVVDTRPRDWEQPRFDISGFIGSVNAMKARTPALNVEGPQERFTDPTEPVVGLVRRMDDGEQRVASLINPDPAAALGFQTQRLAGVLRCAPNQLQEITPERDTADVPPDGEIRVAARDIRVFAVG